MKLLITPAFRPTMEQMNELRKNNEVYQIDNGKKILIESDIPCKFDELEGIICNFFFQYNDFRKFSKLRFVQLTSVGTDRIPVEKMKQEGIRVFTAGDSYVIPMAEWAICKTFEICKRSSFFFENQKKRIWEKNRDVDELYGKTAAIIGFGNVGKNIARRLRPFGVSIHSVDLIQQGTDISDRHFCIEDIGRAVQDADLIYLTLPLNASTYHLVDKALLGQMKQNAILVNVSRGRLIDENALICFLDSGKFSGVALDVFEDEPLSPSSKLWAYEHVLLSPHNSFVGTGNQKRLYRILLSNLEIYGTENGQ